MKHFSSCTFAIAAFALALAGCGGGSGSSGSEVADPQAAAANTPPTISSVQSQSVAQDASSDVISFTVSDVESNAAAVAVTAESSNPELISVDGIQLSGNGASRALLLTPNDGAAGSSTVTLTATDAEGLSARQSFDVTVTAEERSFREMVDTAHAQEAESEGEQIVGYSWVDNPQDDDTAFDHLFVLED